MQNRLQFYPDIETKYDHLITHMNDKNKLTKQLIKVLKDLCDLEAFYYSSLDRCADALSKLFEGKDPIKDILMNLEHIISSKAVESEKLAKSIKDDLMPHLEASINVKAQQALKDKVNDVRNIRASMQRKIKMLFSNESNFKKAVADVNNLPKVMPMADRDKALEAYRKKQDQFSDAIDSYNSSLNDYMLKYSQICEQLSVMETQRKMQYRDAIRKMVVFQIDFIKNLEYNFKRYMDNLDKMDGKLIIQDKVLEFGQPFYERKQNETLHLAKISNKNYIDSIVGKKKVNESLLNQEIKVSELKSVYPPGQTPKDTYHSLVRTLFPILNFVQKNHHTNLLIQIVLFSKGIFMANGALKLTLLTSLLTHPLFQSQQFWSAYQKRLMQKITREQNLTSGDQKYLHHNFNNVLDRDLAMLLSVQIHPFITRVITTVCERAKLAVVVQPPQNAQAGDSGLAGRPGYVLKYPIFQ